MGNQLLLNLQQTRGVSVHATGDLAKILTATITVCIIALTVAAIVKMHQ